MTARELILRDVPAAAVIAIVSIGLGSLLLNGWLWFAALMGAYYVGKQL
jgi:hypothetical protein